MTVTTFWRNWLDLWCLAVGIFGVVLMTGAFAATDGIVRALFDVLNGAGDFEMTGALRFAVALLGVVTLGWSATLFVAMRAAALLGSRGQPIWQSITATVVAWYVVDSGLSVATGFGLNALSNTVFVAAYLLPVLSSGVLRPVTRAASRARS